MASSLAVTNVLVREIRSSHPRYSYMIRLWGILVITLIAGCKKRSPNEPTSGHPVQSTAAPVSELAPGQHVPTEPSGGLSAGSEPKTGMRASGSPIVTNPLPLTGYGEDVLIQSVKFYNDYLSELKSKLSSISVHQLHSSVCPPSEFVADGSSAQLDWLLNETPSSMVVVLKGGRRVIKVMQPEFVEKALNERAALHTIARSSIAHIAPKIASSTSLSAACAMRSFVMNLVEGQSLLRLAISQRAC